MSGDCELSNIYLYNRSYIKAVTIKEQSYMNGIYLCDDYGTDSYIENIQIFNNSSFSSIFIFSPYSNIGQKPLYALSWISFKVF